MTGPLALLPSRRAVRRVDVLALVGAALSIALGVFAGVELARLAPLGTGLQQAASALESTGHALDAMSGVPIVGSRMSDLAGGIVTTAAAVRAGAAQATDAVRELAVLIGIAVALVPGPTLVAYLLLRLQRARALRELRALLSAPHSLEPALTAQLAQRALVCLPYARLRSVSDNPCADLAAGRHERLAAAELERLGLTPPKEWRSSVGSGTERSSAGAAQPPRPAAGITHERDQRGDQQ